MKFAPQIIFFVLTIISLMIAAREHGYPKTGDHNVVVTIISTVLNIWLLWWGGFFDVFITGAH